jgi:hypothetical protein
VRDRDPVLVEKVLGCGAPSEKVHGDLWKSCAMLRIGEIAVSGPAPNGTKTLGVFVSLFDVLANSAYDVPLSPFAKVLLYRRDQVLRR